MLNPQLTRLSTRLALPHLASPMAVSRYGRITLIDFNFIRKKILTETIIDFTMSY